MLKQTPQAAFLLISIASLSLVSHTLSVQIATTTTTGNGKPDDPPPPPLPQDTAGLDLEEPTGFFEANSLQDKFSRRITFDQYVTYALRSVSLVAGFDNDLHRYDNQLDLINSFERNLTYGDDLSSLRAHIDSSELDLLQEASELTLIENERNQENCAAQLDFIYEESLKLFRDYNSFTQSKRLDLIDFLDSYGSAPSEQLMMANSFWLGSFDQCREARVEQTDDMAQQATATARTNNQRGRRSFLASKPAIKGRYCVAHLRLPSWTRAKQADKVSLGSESIKMGVCLPRACNSISMLRHSSRIESLIRLARLQQVPYSSLRLMQLYCLPDEASPLRQFSPSARLFLGVVAVWLLLVAFASIKYEMGRARRQSAGENPDQAAEDSKLVRVFAFRYACQQLFNNRPPAQRAASGDTLQVGALKEKNLNSAVYLTSSFRSSIIMKIQSNRDALAANRKLDDRESPSNEKQLSVGPEQVAVAKPTPKASSNGLNLAVIDGIKVLSMIWLISAHTMLFFIRNITNGRQFWSILLDARFMTIMAGIFPVDSFFTVTGVLTSYLKFNKSSSSSSSSSPSATSSKSPDESKVHRRRPMLTVSYWLEIFIHRYLRFMPMYLLIFWYTRDISEYIGSGPMWDYATAQTSLRSICKRESVWVPMLFQANFKPIEQHCVKPAWYLANDYQYLLITPLFMLLLVASKWLGYLVIGAGVLASLAMQFATVYQPDWADWWPTSGESTSATNGPPPFQHSTPGATFTDFEALINFKPMFATYVLKDLWRLYVLPYNRCPPYLIGLLTGHLMYCCAKQRRRNSSVPPSTTMPTMASSEKLLRDDNNDSNMASTESLVSDSARKLNNNADAAGPAPASSFSSEKLVEKPVKPSGTLGVFARHLDMSIWSPIALLVAVIYLPLSTRLMDEQKGETARVGASLIIALMRLVWSLSVARLIYVCFRASLEPVKASSRSFVVGLLSSAKWRPWSKICLSVLLIQWEIIAYLAQIQPVQNVTFSLLLAFVIISIIASYVIGLLVYLLFEFPLSQIEQLYVSPKLFPSTTKQMSS